MKELLLGAGNARLKRFAATASNAHAFENLTTVDIDPGAKPDFIWDLNKMPWPRWRLGGPAPQARWATDDTYDEVHAYEVLEHLGQQGDWRSYFAMFSEIYRVLKPGGYLCASCPSITSRWLWGDPGHTRVISPESLTFLDQSEYTKQVGNTAMTDYRAVWKDDFCLTGHKDDGDSLMFILQAVKPSRISI